MSGANDEKKKISELTQARVQDLNAALGAATDVGLTVELQENLATAFSDKARRVIVSAKVYELTEF